MTSLPKIAAAVGIAFVAMALTRHADPTYAEDVAPVFFKNCASCHRTGGQAPFSILYYDSAAAHLDEMRDAIRTGAMPPWHAEGPRGVFRNDRRLSDAERQLILRWIETGAKPGDMKKLPARPQFSTSWEMGTPDLVVSMQEDFVVPASGTIEYMHFQVPTNLTEEKWVRAIEIRPGAREVVHHVLVYARAPAPPGAAPTPPAPRPEGTPAPPPLFVRNRAHGQPQDPPRRDSLHARPRQTGPLIASLAPGTNVVEFPAGTALRLRPGTILTLQMHYTAHGMEMKDRTSVGFRFASDLPEEEILANQFTNGSFTIPAGAKDVAVPAELGVSQPVRIWGLLPHTHLRGTRWLYKLEKPDGTSEVILDMPRYDFNWQTYYLFAKPLEVPAGGKITSMAWYDNSADNKNNPNPSVEVKWGDQTWEEMQYTGFLYSVPSRRLRPTERP
jgi:mono/diheme cytochrome c family protein